MGTQTPETLEQIGRARTAANKLHHDQYLARLAELFAKEQEGTLKEAERGEVFDMVYRHNQ